VTSSTGTPGAWSSSKRSRSDSEDCVPSICDLDLRRENGFLPDVGVEGEVRVRKEGGYAIEPSQGERRSLEEALHRTGKSQWRLGGQGERDERPDGLAADRHCFVPSC